MSAPPEHTDPTDGEPPERLLEYDAELAAGSVPAEMKADELPDDIREGLSCLEMLERLRLSDRASRMVAPLTKHDPPDPSLLDAPTGQLGLGSSEEAMLPAQLGRFRILKILGQGGCGVVFLAHDPALHRQVAIKVPRPEALFTPQLRQRFIREGRAAACLDHANLVTVFEAGEIGAVCYLASAYCPGITLRDWLQKYSGPVPPRAAAKLIATLAEAMDYAHQKGVCHRDLKPSNILLQIIERDAGERLETADAPLPCRDLQSAIPKIIDFGLAKVIRDDGAEAATRTGAVFGTPLYMAPEQAQGQTQTIGPPTDIHALGIILYELLTGQLPYQGDTDLKILGQVIAVEPDSPSRLSPCVPRDLETICLKCLEKQPEKRYGSMRELGEDLERFLDGRPIQARRIGWAARAAKLIRRRPRATAAGALIGALLFSLGAVLVWINSRESALSTDMAKAWQEVGVQKARAEESDWLARNQQYAAQIRAAGLLKNQTQLAMLRDVLLSQQPAPDQKDLRGFEWAYLWCFVQGFKLPDNQAPVTAIAYSQNAQVCASGDLDGGVNLFSTRTGKRLARWQGHSLFVRRLDFLKNDTQLLSMAFGLRSDGGFRSEFVLWDLADENKVLRRGDYSHAEKMFGHPNLALAPAAHILFIIDRRRTPYRLLMLDLETGTERLLLTSEHLQLVATTPNADRVAVVQRQDWVEIIEPATMRQVSSCRFSKPVHMAEFSPDGKVLALGVGWVDGPRVEIREAPSLRLLKSLEFATLPTEFRFDPQGKRMAIMTGQTDFHFFDIQTGAALGSFKDEGAMALAFSPDGEELAIGTRDGRVRTGKNVFDRQEHSFPGPLPLSEAWCVAFAPKGNTLASGYDNENGVKHETLRLWDLTAKKAKSLAGHDATVMALAFGPDGKTLATASHDRTVRLWDMAAGKCVHEMRGHTDAVRALAISPDGRRIASAGSDLAIKTWNGHDGSLQNSWLGHSDAIRSLAFSPDGALLISAANDCTIKIWNAQDGSLVRAIADEAKVQCIACSPDGTLLASGNENNRVELWHLGTGALWKILPGHAGKVRSVAFSPDGKTLASGGEDKMVRLWNVVTGQELLVLPTEHIVNGLAFDPGKPILAAALHDGTVKLWSGE